MEGELTTISSAQGESVGKRGCQNLTMQLYGEPIHLEMWTLEEESNLT